MWGEKWFFILRNVENALISRSMPRSVPDSGIEPDDVSEESSITDYLTQIGVTYNQVIVNSCYVFLNVI